MTPKETAQIEHFLNLLHNSHSLSGVFNPWRDYDRELDIGPQAPEMRRANLRAYLTRRQKRTKILLVAEAPGYQGAKFSGIAMTCERTILGNKVGIAPEHVLGEFPTRQRTSNPNTCQRRAQAALGYNEPTATHVWKELVATGTTDETVLWNVFPFHPHVPGKSLTNRTPTDAEVESRIDIMLALRGIFPAAAVVAIGGTSQRHLNRVEIAANPVRHPSYGGAPEYLTGLKAVRATLALAALPLKNLAVGTEARRLIKI